MKINVVGLGPGNIKYISAAGIECIKEAEILKPFPQKEYIFLILENKNELMQQV